MREETIKVVSVLDPAIDTETMTTAEIVEYAKTRADYRRLRYKPNQKPTVFHLREIRHQLMESWVLEDAGNEAQVARRCFQAAVFKVENLYQRDGHCLDVWEPKNPDNTRANTIPDESLERFSLSERIEIGQVAWDHSFLPPRIAPSYRLPPMSANSLARREFLPAGASQSLPAGSRDEALQERGSAPLIPPETAPDSSDGAGNCDSATAATAEATT